MRSFMRFFATLFLLSALLMASDIGPMGVAEARTCESQSQRFSGVCLSGSNCAAVCQSEGFQGGDCQGFRRRCFCTQPC